MRVSKKIFLTILSLVFLFSMSCGSNTDPNSGGGDYSVPFSASVNDLTSQKNITIKSEGTSSENAAAGKIDFFVSGSYSYSVSISKVDKGSSPVDFTPSDFEYNQNSKELKLSSAGLTKFETSKAQLTEKTKYEYTITFKFTDSDKEVSTDVKVNLIKGELIDKTKIENMMKQIKYYEGGSIGATTLKDGDFKINADDLIGGAIFNFTNATFSSTSPNFFIDETTTADATSSESYRASSKSQFIVWAITETALFKQYFVSSVDPIEYRSPAPQISASDKKVCTFYLRFKNLQDGYVLSDDVKHITNYAALTIKLNFKQSSKREWL